MYLVGFQIAANVVALALLVALAVLPAINAERKLADELLTPGENLNVGKTYIDRAASTKLG